ncbi:MAG: hypothetical protein ACK4UU_04110, partial [Fimbriimonadales bacterium]
MRISTLLGLVTTLLVIGAAQSLKVSYHTERQSEGDFYKIDISVPQFPKGQPLGALANRQIASVVKQFKRDFRQAVEN